MATNNKPPARQEHPEAISKLVWSWPFVAFVVAVSMGGGLTFMTSTHPPYIADVFFLIGAFFFLVALFNRDVSKKKRKYLNLDHLQSHAVTKTVRLRQDLPRFSKEKDYG